MSKRSKLFLALAFIVAVVGVYLFAPQGLFTQLPTAPSWELRLQNTAFPEMVYTDTTAATNQQRTFSTPAAQAFTIAASINFPDISVEVVQVLRDGQPLASGTDYIYTAPGTSGTPPAVGNINFQSGAPVPSVIRIDMRVRSLLANPNERIITAILNLELPSSGGPNNQIASTDKTVQIPLQSGGTTTAEVSYRFSQATGWYMLLEFPGLNLGGFQARLNLDIGNGMSPWVPRAGTGSVDPDDFYFVGNAGTEFRSGAGANNVFIFPETLSELASGDTLGGIVVQQAEPITGIAFKIQNPIADSRLPTGGENMSLAQLVLIDDQGGLTNVAYGDPNSPIANASISLHASNEPPTIPATPFQFAVEETLDKNNPSSLTITFTGNPAQPNIEDADNDELAISFETLPNPDVEGKIFASGQQVVNNRVFSETEIFSFEPELGFTGSLNVEVSAYDRIGPSSSNGSVNIVVTAFNNAPNADIVPLPGGSPPVGAVIALDGANSSDPGGQITAFLWEVTVGDPAAAVFNPSPNEAKPTVTFSAPGQYTVQLTVTDNGAPPKTGTATITIDINDPPVSQPAFTLNGAAFNSGGTMNEGDTLNFTAGTSSDLEDGTPTRFTATSLLNNTNNTIQEDTATGTGTFTPTVAGAETITYTVGDSDNATGSSQITFTINDRPILNPTPASPIVQLLNTPLQFDAGATDANGIATYEWLVTLGDPASVNITDPAITNPSITFTASGDYQITLSVEDTLGAIATETIEVTANQVPVANIATLPLDINEGDNLIIGGATSFDPDGTIASHTWTEITATGINFTGNGTPQITLTTPAGGTTIEMQLEVTDNNGATNSNSVVFTVNTPPTASFTLTPQNFIQGETLTLTSTSSDTDGTITGQLWGDLSGVGINFIPDAVSLSVTFTAPAAGTTFEIGLQATDNNQGVGQTSQTFTVNTPPTVSATGQILLEPNVQGTAVATATDTNGSIATYAWTSSDPNAVTIDTPETASTTFRVNTAGTYTVSVEVTDNQGAINSASFDVDVNTIPVAVATGPQSLDTNQTGQAVGSTSTDAEDGANLTYAWSVTQGDAASVSFTTPATADTDFTVSTPGIYTLTLTVTDSGPTPRTATANFTVNVSVPNTPPRAENRTFTTWADSAGNIAILEAPFYPTGSPVLDEEHEALGSITPIVSLGGLTYVEDAEDANDALTFGIETPPPANQGEVTQISGTTFVFRPGPDMPASLTIPAFVEDTRGARASFLITINVLPLGNTNKDTIISTADIFFVVASFTQYLNSLNTSGISTADFIRLNINGDTVISVADIFALVVGVRDNSLPLTIPNIGP